MEDKKVGRRGIRGKVNEHRGTKEKRMERYWIKKGVRKGLKERDYALQGTGGKSSKGRNMG